MIKQTLEFSTKKGAQLFPVALNTFHSAIDPAQLLSNEVVINKDVIRAPNGELTTHPKWKHIYLAGCTRIITDYYIKTAFIEEQFLIFGHYDDGGQTKGFVGRIKYNDLQIAMENPGFVVEKLITDLNPNTIPQFVSYLKGIYIFLGSGKLQFYDGVEVKDPGGDLKDKLALVGCALHGRLFYVVVESPGKVQMTTIGTETHDSDILCGDIGEQITGLMPTDESLLIFKDREFYEFNYGLNIAEGELKTRSKKVGCSYHTLLQKKFDMIYTMNKQGIYLINPKYIKATGREVIVEPDIIDIGLSIKNKVVDLDVPGYVVKLWLEDTFDAGDYTSSGLTFGDKIENAKSPVGTIEEFTYHCFDWIIRELYYYAQSFMHQGSGQVATELKEMYIWQDENNPITSNVIVELCEDFGGAPGDILKDKDGEDADVELEPGDIPVGWPGVEPIIDFNEVSLDKNTTYWIQVRFKTNTGSEEIFWKFEHCLMPGVHHIYANGRMSTDDPGWSEEVLADSDARFRISGFYYIPSGWLISNNPIVISGISEWKTFSVMQNVGTHCAINHYIREFGIGDWIAIEPDGNIPDALKHVTQLQWKAVFSTEDYNYNYKSYIDTVWFTGVCVGDGKAMVSGLREDRYYVFGKDKSDNDVFLCFAKDGWLNVDKSDDNFIYGQCHDDIEVNDFKILGVGRAVDDDKGCLMYALDPDDADYLNMPMHIKTGRLLLDKIPKKGRKIFIVYQGKNVVLKCYTEHDTKTFNLADAEDGFNIEELGFGTSRTKWFTLEIVADKNFKQKELSLNFKAHREQEV